MPSPQRLARICCRSRALTLPLQWYWRVARLASRTTSTTGMARGSFCASLRDLMTMQCNRGIAFRDSAPGQTLQSLQIPCLRVKTRSTLRPSLISNEEMDDERTWTQAHMDPRAARPGGSGDAPPGRGQGRAAAPQPGGDLGAERGYDRPHARGRSAESPPGQRRRDG